MKNPLRKWEEELLNIEEARNLPRVSKSDYSQVGKNRRGSNLTE